MTKGNGIEQPGTYCLHCIIRTDKSDWKARVEIRDATGELFRDSKEQPVFCTDGSKAINLVVETEGPRRKLFWKGENQNGAGEKYYPSWYLGPDKEYPNVHKWRKVKKENDPLLGDHPGNEFFIRLENDKCQDPTTPGKPKPAGPYGCRLSLLSLTEYVCQTGEDIDGTWCFPPHGCANDR